MVWQKHMRSRKPIQLKRKAVTKAVKKTKSLPSRVVSPGEDGEEEEESYSEPGRVRRVMPETEECCPGLPGLPSGSPPTA